MKKNFRARLSYKRGGNDNHIPLEALGKKAIVFKKGLPTPGCTSGNRGAKGGRGKRRYCIIF